MADRNTRRERATLHVAPSAGWAVVFPLYHQVICTDHHAHHCRNSHNSASRSEPVRLIQGRVQPTRRRGRKVAPGKAGGQSLARSSAPAAGHFGNHLGMVVRAGDQRGNARAPLHPPVDIVGMRDGMRSRAAASRGRAAGSGGRCRGMSQAVRGAATPYSCGARWRQRAIGRWPPADAVGSGPRGASDNAGPPLGGRGAE